MKSSKRFTTIEEYIASFPKKTAQKLQAIRKLVRTLAPEAQEVISYNMPAFKLNGILLYFAGYANHIGVYPYPATLVKFSKELADYKSGKSTIKIPLSEQVPLDLLKKVITYRIEEKRQVKKK